jgi:murein hydrolase activator
VPGRNPRRGFLLAALALLVCALPAAAQQNIQRDLRASQLKLDSIQAERYRLEREMGTLRSRVRDASRELLNIERQREVSRSALLELEYQAQLLTDNVETTTLQHEQTQARLQRRSLDRDARLRAIYKRGPMHAAQVLLTAQSFADLMNRYKYLHLMALYDRMIVEDVAQLERQLFAQESELRGSLRQLESLRQDKFTEVTQLERVESERQTTLRQYRQQATSTASRLMELEREQTRLASAVEDLERRRREEEARSPAPSQPGTITTRDLGTLPWPVDGNIVYRFGPDRKPDGIVLRNQGIGIGAAAGTAVRAVESGTVEFAGPFPGYGPTVIVSHGGGYRTLYLYLKTVGVQVHQQVNAGDAIGTVGGEQSADGPHIEFQVRVPREGTIEPVDPLAWLRARGT